MTLVQTPVGMLPYLYGRMLIQGMQTKLRASPGCIFDSIEAPWTGQLSQKDSENVPKKLQSNQMKSCFLPQTCYRCIWCVQTMLPGLGTAENTKSWHTKEKDLGMWRNQNLNSGSLRRKVLNSSEPFVGKEGPSIPSNSGSTWGDRNRISKLKT